jgi:hypothetical protein
MLQGHQTLKLTTPPRAKFRVRLVSAMLDSATACFDRLLLKTLRLREFVGLLAVHVSLLLLLHTLLLQGATTDKLANVLLGAAFGTVQTTATVLLVAVVQDAAAGATLVQRLLGLLPGTEARLG